MRVPINFSLKGAEDRDDVEPYHRLKEYRSNINSHVERGDNLYIHSVVCGNGKTEWAVTMLRAYIGSIWHTSDLKCRALFVHVPTFLQKLKDNIGAHNEFAQYIKDNIQDAV